MKKATEISYVRFHAILHDEVGVYDEDEAGEPTYNFTYVDQIYDGLLENGVRPFVEISFMPKKLASNKDAIHPFWYKQNVSPPKDFAKWDALMLAFAEHLVQRYGIDEVSKWYFEVWNEPNIDFWAGDPKQATYFELYAHTARTLKAVNSRLRVGGPSTAAADWVDGFLAYCAKNNVPVDFVSSHGYADDTVENLFHTNEEIPMNQRICRAIRKVHDQIQASPRPGLPLMWTEWNVPSYGPKNARDTSFVAPEVASYITQCDGLVDMMSYWTFDDVFEENGVERRPFNGTFGLITVGGIKKPSYAGFSLLHKLGHERIVNENRNMLVTRREDGTLVIAAWNVVPPDASGSTRRLRLNLRNVSPNAHVRIWRADDQHRNSLAAYEAMGRPTYPTREQVRKLNAAAELVPEEGMLHNGSIDLELPPNNLTVIEVGK